VGDVLVDIDQLSAGYEGAPVVHHLELKVRAGEVVALLGPNGAGKTTLLLTVAGVLQPIGGAITMFGVPTLGRAADVRARDGLALVPDERALFGSLSTEENLRAVRRRGSLSVEYILEVFPALAARRNIRAGLLSGGEQQMLAIGRALINRPKLLLLDEMSTGLAPEIVRGVLPVIRSAATDGGAGIVLVEQHVGLALSIADVAVVMVHGSVTLHSTPAELRADPRRLEEAYLGTSAVANTAGSAS
jgi:branched-chain amino acid transport system ATP-binding protein